MCKHVDGHRRWDRRATCCNVCVAQPSIRLTQRVVMFSQDCTAHNQKRDLRNDPTAGLASSKGLFHRLARRRAVLSPPAELDKVQIWYRGLAGPECPSSAKTMEGGATCRAANKPWSWVSDKSTKATATPPVRQLSRKLRRSNVHWRR